jgi:hypothetical protein
LQPALVKTGITDRPNDGASSASFAPRARLDQQAIAPRIKSMEIAKRHIFSSGALAGGLVGKQM